MKDIKSSAKTGAYKICTKKCISSYPTCSRHGTRFLPLVGKGTICPLAKYDVPEQDEPTEIMDILMKMPTLMDAVALCANCEHAELDIKDGGYSINRTDDNFRNYCLDCPTQMVVEAINEREAEAET